MKKSIFLLAAFVVLLSACITIESTTIKEEDKVPMDDLKLEKGYDVYHFRVDLVRSEVEKNKTNQEGQNNPKKKEDREYVPYHYLGVRFGNGLFYDYNKNLCVDLIEFFKLNENEFTVTQKSRELFGPSTIYKRSGSSFKREVKTMLGNKTTAEFKDSEVYIEEGLLKTDVQILLTDDEIQCNPKGVFGFLAKAKVRNNGPDSVEFPGFWKDSVFTQDNVNQISLNREFHITNAGTEIIIEYKGLFGNSGTYRFVKIKNGFTFSDKMNNIVKVEKEGNTIRIQPSEGMSYTAVIE
jgi:hypothetical protein